MNMRRTSKYIVFLFSLVIVLSGCYYFSYRNALSKFNESSVEKNYELMSYLKEITERREDSKDLNQVAAVDTTSEAKIIPETVYKLETYDVKTNTMKTEILKTPGKFIGLTRNELMQLLSQEMLDLPLEEYQKGLISYVVISFSEKEIVLRKSYNSDLIQYKYYIAINQGTIVVYHCDKKTIFDHTGIDATKLSEKIQAELSIGKYVRDEEELYSLLESYSS